MTNRIAQWIRTLFSPTPPKTKPKIWLPPGDIGL